MTDEDYDTLPGTTALQISLDDKPSSDLLSRLPETTKFIVDAVGQPGSNKWVDAINFSLRIFQSKKYERA